MVRSFVALAAVGSTLGSASSWADCSAQADQNASRVETLQRQVAPLIEADGAQLQLRLIGTLPNMAHPALRLLTQGLHSRVAVELSGKVCGQSEPVMATVWFEVHALREVWVYGRNTKGDRPLSEAEPHRQTLDIAALQISADELVSNPDGQWLKQSVSSGSPVLKRQLQAEPLVSRAEPVTVLVYGPGLMLRTQGKAMRPGAMGDTVPVMLDGANSSLLAVVAGKGEVHVGN